MSKCSWSREALQESEMVLDFVVNEVLMSVTTVLDSVVNDSSDGPDMY